MSETHVTVTLTSDLVTPLEAEGIGRPAWLARMPQGTRLGGHDLSGATIVAHEIRESDRYAGLAHIVLDGSRDVEVALASGDTVHVSPSGLREAAGLAIALGRERAVCERAARLLSSGEREAAHEALRTLLAGVVTPLPPVPESHPCAVDAASRHEGELLAFEALGVLAAHLTVCPVSTHSPTAEVPARYGFVAFCATRCVTAERFGELLALARSSPPRHGGTLEEHSIGYVARQLAQPFARLRGRTVVELNGRGADVTDDVLAIPRTPTPPPATDPASETLDLGVARLTVDRAALMESLGIGLPEADAISDWLMARARADVEAACDRMGVESVSLLLRSPEAVCVLLKAGVTLERRESGGNTGDGISVTSPVSEGVLRECAEHVSGEAGWRVRKDDAVALLRDEPPLTGVLARARVAWAADAGLMWRDRIDTAPSRSRSDGMLEDA